MIIVAPQLNDWGETSARQTIALTEYFLEVYNIDRSRVYGEGYSGGGETMSQVMGMRPELFTAYLQGSSQWDGDYEPVFRAEKIIYQEEEEKIGVTYGKKCQKCIEQENIFIFDRILFGNVCYGG